MKGEKPVSVMIVGTTSMKFTLAISVAIDGTKPPLFTIFKATPGGSVEKQLPHILPDIIVGCVQAKGRMDDRTKFVWYERVYKPYISSCQRESGLLLDDFVCHKSQELKDKLNTDDSVLYLIPPHYTGLLQPCDIGINKSFRTFAGSLDQMLETMPTWERFFLLLPRNAMCPEVLKCEWLCRSDTLNISWQAPFGWQVVFVV